MTLRLALNFISIIFFSSGSAQLFASPSIFSASDVEKSLIDYFQAFHNFSENQNEGKGWTASDQLEFANALADQITIFPVPTYNDIIGHVLAHYRHGLKDRKAIELLISRIKVKLDPTFKSQNQTYAVLTIIDDVLIAWTLVYSFKFSRGLWMSRGTGLRGIPRFREAAQTIFRGLGTSTRTKLGIVAAGTATGGLHALYLHLEQKRLDPSRLVLSLQESMIKEIAHQIIAYRNELRVFKGQLRAEQRLKDFENKTESIETHCQALQSEMESFFELAPRFRNQMQPIAMDLRETEQRLEQIKIWIAKQSN